MIHFNIDHNILRPHDDLKKKYIGSYTTTFRITN